MNQNNHPIIKFLIAMVTLGGITSAILILASKELNSDNTKVVAVTAAMLLYGITGIICLATGRKREYSTLGNLGMLVSLFAFAMACIVIIGELESETVAKIAFNLMIISIALAHICFLFYINLHNRYAVIVRTAAIIFITLFSMLIVVKVFGNLNEFFFDASRNEIYVRILLASLILDFTATLLVPLCNRLKPTGPGSTGPLPPPTGSPEESGKMHQSEPLS